jgi:phosphoglucosamine mutase
VCHLFEPLPQILKNVRTGDRRPLDNGNVRKMIEELNGRLGARGRLVVRASGTEPVIRVMAEGDDPAMVTEIVDDLIAALSDAAA